MAKEDLFILEAMKAAEQILAAPLLIRLHATLLYQVTVNSRLEITVDPKVPRRGQSAFQTDLCVFEEVETELQIPRVVMEFKSGLTTHDVLTYSAKARKHKQVYPYLRYGIVIANESAVPGRFFTHNEALDFCVAAGFFKKDRIHELLASVLRDEVAASRRLEEIAYDRVSAHLYRSEVILETSVGKVS